MEEYYNEKMRKKQVIKTIKNILVKLIYILLLPIILWDLIIIVQTIQKPNETPSVFGIKTFCIISGSMEPTISVNDIVIIKEVEQNEIKRGDIIAFKHKGETITHRIIKISKDENGELLYTTQGDANNTEDEDKSDKIIIVKASSKDTIENIERALSSEIVGITDSWKENDQESKKIENHIFKTKDVYVIMAISDKSEEIEKIFDSCFE